MGIYYDKRTHKYIARSRLTGGKRTYLGTFDTKLDAKNAVKEDDMIREMGRLKARETEHKEEVATMSRLHEAPVQYIALKSRVFGIPIQKIRTYLRDLKQMRKSDREFKNKMQRW